MIFRNTRGRYELDQHELTSGDVIEVKRGEQWERGRVEYNHERRDYVILLTLGGTMQITSDISLRRPEKEK